MKDNFPRAWMAAVFLPVILFGCSSVIYSYGYNDDYHVLYDILTGRFSSLGHVLTRDGRFLTAVLVEAGFSMLETVGDLRYVRAAGLLFTGLAAVCYFLVLRTAGFGKPFAASLAIVTFTTPAFAVYNSWAICFPYPLGALLGLGSGVLIHNAIQGRELGIRVRYMLMAIGILLTIVCYWIYQPIAFFSLLAGGILAWKDVSSTTMKAVQLPLFISIFIACTGLYILFNNQLTGLLGIPPSGRTEWAPDVMDRLQYMAGHTLPAASTGWIAPISPLAAKVAMAVSAMLIVLSFLIKGGREFALRLILSVSILFLSIFTYSLFKDAYLAYRLYAGPSAWILFLLWWAVSVLWQKWHLNDRRFLRWTAVSGAGAMLGLWLLAYLAIPSKQLHQLNADEYAAVLQCASEELETVPKALDIVLPAHYERTMKAVFWAEFKTRSSHMPWVAPKMVTLAVDEAHGDPGKRAASGPIDLFYATGNDSGRPVFDLFGIVHAGEWEWVQHPFFGRSRKVRDLEFHHSPVFGVFDNAEYPYIYHLGLGWIYVINPDQSIAQLLEHRNLECTFSEESFPILMPQNEPPLRYDPFIGYRPRLLQADGN